MNTTLQSGHGKESLLTAQEFIEISQANGWGKNKTYDLEKVVQALENTFYLVTIRSSENELLACGRALSDDMFFTTIPDIFVHPDHHRKGYGSRIMEKIKERLGHTVIFFGAQPGKGQFYEKLGFEKGLQSYSMKFKPSL